MANRPGLVRFSSLALAFAVLASCGGSEESILITARVSGTDATVIESVNFAVIPLMSDANPVMPATTSVVHRTAAEINGEQPIRVAISLHDSTPVMVHIYATTASGTRLYATRCYMPAGVLRDEVLLVETDASVDVDADGWPSPAHVEATCRDPGPGANGVACDVGLCSASDAGDCNDMAPPATPVDCSIPDDRVYSPCIHPGALTRCSDTIDQDCRANGLPGGSRDEPCGDADGDGSNDCGPAGGVCDCNDMDPSIHPGATDICGNRIDEDCSGEPGGGGAACDNDGDGYPGGPGQPDCDDTNPDVHPGGLDLEACRMVGADCVCDGIDNNCNHLVDEDASCASPDLDGDGADACMGGATDCGSCDCNDCDSAIHPGAMEICGDGIDEDGDGSDTTCDPADTDHDGFTGGQDCGEGDARVHIDAPENCTTGTSESCGSMVCTGIVDTDTDGFASVDPAGTDCDDMDADVNPWATEVCNGIDDDCDGNADEVLDPTNATGCVTDRSCPGGGRCLVTFATNLHHCGTCRHECNPGSTLVADQCVAGSCSCSTNTAGGQAACAVGSTCCAVDSTGHAVTYPGCFDTNTATQNCGGCGNVCDPTVADQCVGGHCVCGSTGDVCGPGTTCCGGQCVSLANDVANCGSCGHQCGARTSCSGGTCGCDDAALHGDCNGDLGMPSGNGCETDLQTDSSHCGSCPVSCLDDHVASGSCSAGACVITTCAPLWGDCSGGAANGCETDLSTTTNCGGCGTACAPMHANAVCNVSGSTASCGYGMCQASYASCDSNVVNGCEQAQDASHCGLSCTNCSSTVAHGTGLGCSGAGACTFSGCASGYVDCDGAATLGCETTEDVGHCGSGCTSCTMTLAHVTGAACTSGACTFASCQGGYVDCNAGSPGCETTEDASHCGGSCTNCTSMYPRQAVMCTSGACAAGNCTAGFANCTAAPGCETGEDASHCGTSCTDCTMAFPHQAGTCSSATCTPGACQAGWANCSAPTPGCETAEDATHCGGSCTNCMMQFPHQAGSCSSGSCMAGACQSGWVNCTAAPGCETMEDATHCGGSCTNCQTGYMNGNAACTGSACDIGTCTGGFADCDSNVMNGCERSTTGMDGDCCGMTCTGGTHCSGSPTTGFRCN